MGCCFENLRPSLEVINFENENAKHYYQAYLSIKDIIKWIKTSKVGIAEVYLVSKQSIPNLSNILFNQNSILYKIFWENELVEQHENELKRKLSEYKLDKNITFLTNYQQCMEYKQEKDNKENEFIIVDEKFIKSMGLDKEEYTHKKVELYINNMNKGNYKIQFPNDEKKKIYIKEKKRGIYKFCDKAINNNNNIIISNNDIVKYPTFFSLSKESDLSRKMSDKTESKNLTELINSKSNRNCQIFFNSNNNV